MVYIRKFPVILILWASVFASVSPQDKPFSPVETITAEAIRHHVYFLAADALEGRYAGSKGYQIAAQYGASQFQASGLKPIIKQGDQFGYLQTVPVVKRTSKAEPELVVRTAKGETKFVHGKDFRWLDGEMLSCENKPLTAIFVGYGIHEPAAGWDDFKGLDVRNKVIVMLPGAPLKNGKSVLPEALHRKYASESSWQVKVPGLMAMPAAAILVTANESMLNMWDDIPVQTNEPQIALNDRNADAWGIATLFAAKPEIIQALFAGQKHALPKADARDTSKVKGFDIKGATLFLSTTFQDEEVPAWNVVGIAEGTDPVLKNEYIAVTAHLDHFAPNDKGEIMNGADDNASGCAGVMEIAEAIALNPFKRSVVFILFAGEETLGLGSRHFLAACPVLRNKIIADINLDMIGRTEKESESDRAHYALDTDNVRPEFKKLIMEVNDRTIRWPLKFDRQPRTGSDNLVFEWMCKIPGVFFWSGGMVDLHKPTDDADKIDYEKAEKIARLGYEITKELATQTTLWR